MRSLALLPAQKIFAPLRLYRQRYILRLKNTSFGCRQLINKTQLRSAAAPALSSSVAVALCLPLPGAARPLLSAAATVLLSSPPPSLSSCSSPRISCRHPTPSSPSPLSFPRRLLIVVLSGGQSRCYQRWCRRPLLSGAFVVHPCPLSPLPMADVITSPLPSQPALQRYRRRRRVLPSSSAMTMVAARWAMGYADDGDDVAGDDVADDDSAHEVVQQRIRQSNEINNKSPIHRFER